jgi:hypothetical protein
MTTPILIMALIGVASLAAGGLWAMRPRHRATVRRRPASDDMFAYTMTDDPC